MTKRERDPATDADQPRRARGRRWAAETREHRALTFEGGAYRAARRRPNFARPDASRDRVPGDGRHRRNTSALGTAAAGIHVGRPQERSNVEVHRVSSVAGASRRSPPRSRPSSPSPSLRRQPWRRRRRRRRRPVPTCPCSSSATLSSPPPRCTTAARRRRSPWPGVTAPAAGPAHRTRRSPASRCPARAAWSSSTPT